MARSRLIPKAPACTSCAARYCCACTAKSRPGASWPRATASNNNTRTRSANSPAAKPCATRRPPQPLKILIVVQALGLHLDSGHSPEMPSARWGAGPRPAAGSQPASGRALADSCKPWACTITNHSSTHVRNLVVGTVQLNVLVQLAHQLRSKPRVQCEPAVEPLLQMPVRQNQI